MNLYFLVEGRRCERKLYPAWLAVLAPGLRQVKAVSQITADSFFLISGEGYPSLLDIHLPNAIQDVENSGRFDWLVVVLDADEDSGAAREAKVRAAVDQASTPLQSARLAVVVQYRCIETWLLGNRKAFVRNPTDPQLRSYVDHHDCSVLDPEAMPPYPGWQTQVQFHHAYLKALCNERGVRYSKSQPGDTATRAYLEQLVRRVQDQPDHLCSFQTLLGFVGHWTVPATAPRPD